MYMQFLTCRKSCLVAFFQSHSLVNNIGKQHVQVSDVHVEVSINEGVEAVGDVKLD